MFSCTTPQHIYLQILYKLYILQLNSTYINYTEAAATCSAAQQHSTFTAQILFKLYSLQLNCTYSTTQKMLLHVQLHNSTAHLLYKYCTNCTVSHWPVLTLTTLNLMRDAQLHNTTQLSSLYFLKCSDDGCLILYVYQYAYFKSCR